MENRTIIKQVGAFHFGDPDKNSRISSLRGALFEVSRRKTLDDCLIVLPEAFNVRGGYRDNPRPRPLDSSVPEALVSLSKEFKVALVAGLINGQKHQRYNCAYLIDGKVWHLLGCKEQSDATCNYAPCGTNSDQPISYRGIWIAALICLDAGASELSERGVRIRAGIGNHSDAVLCIPADTLSITTKSTAERWTSNFHTIVANCNPSPPSVLWMKTASEPTLIHGASNRIEIRGF